MLLEKLKELRKASNMTYEELAEESKTPISTIKHIFAGKCEPLASTLYRIVKAMNGSLDDVLADTNIVLSPKTLIEVKENAEEVEAEKEIIAAKNEMLEAKITAMTMEIELLKKEIQHKDELLAVYNYFTKIKQNE